MDIKVRARDSRAGIGSCSFCDKAAGMVVLQLDADVRYCSDHMPKGEIRALGAFLYKPDLTEDRWVIDFRGEDNNGKQ